MMVKSSRHYIREVSGLLGSSQRPIAQIPLTHPKSNSKCQNANVKLPAHRAGLPGNEISFLFVPLDPAYKAELAGHLPAKPVDNSTTRTINLPHLSFDIWHSFDL
jgi:hypothetical protein